MTLTYMINDFITCACLGAVFLMLTELRYSLKSTVIFVTIAVVILFIGYEMLMSEGVDDYLAAAVSLSLPSLIICFILSKYRDSRFIFTFCSVDIMGFIIIFMAGIIAILFNNSDMVVLIVSVILLSMLLCFAWRFRENYLHIQRVQDSGWHSLAVVSVLFYIMIYFGLANPVFMAERTANHPVGLIFYILMVSVYIVICQTVIKNFRIYDTTKENELLESKIALQKSQLELQEVYYRMAYTDILTGLKNRSAFEEKKKLLLNLDNQAHLTCLVMDLNNLKKTNDLHGHMAGDALLRTFSKILREALDPLTDIYRIGGDEFFVLFTGLSASYVRSQANKLRQQIADYNRTNDLQISVAMGLALMDECDATDLASLIACADEKMYEDKRHIKCLNQVGMEYKEAEAEVE